MPNERDAILDMTLIDVSSDDLSIAEIDLLIDAVRNLPSKGMAGDLMTGMLTALLAPKDDPVAAAELKREQSARQEESTRITRALQSVATIMEAKLTLMRSRRQQ